MLKQIELVKLINLDFYLRLTNIFMENLALNEHQNKQAWKLFCCLSCFKTEEVKNTYDVYEFSKFFYHNLVEMVLQKEVYANASLVSLNRDANNNNNVSSQSHTLTYFLNFEIINSIQFNLFQPHNNNFQYMYYSHSMES